MDLAGATFPRQEVCGQTPAHPLGATLLLATGPPRHCPGLVPAAFLPAQHRKRSAVGTSVLPASAPRSPDRGLAVVFTEDAPCPGTGRSKSHCAPNPTCEQEGGHKWGVPVGVGTLGKVAGGLGKWTRAGCKVRRAEQRLGGATGSGPPDAAWGSPIQGLNLTMEPPPGPTRHFIGAKTPFR